MSNEKIKPLAQILYEAYCHESATETPIWELLDKSCQRRWATVADEAIEWMLDEEDDTPPAPALEQDGE